jgi:hypothetical protein
VWLTRFVPRTLGNLKSRRIDTVSRQPPFHGGGIGASRDLAPGPDGMLLSNPPIY